MTERIVTTAGPLFRNAVESLQLGIEDYGANDSKRALSAVRNFYAGVLLLAKQVLVRAAPNADPKDVLGARYEPVPDGLGGITYDASDRTIDFSEIGKRFKSFGLKIDQAALNDLNRIRNDIEHLYTNANPQTVREAIATAFPVVVDLFRLAGEGPRAALGDSWPAMLEVKAFHDRELAECHKSFDGVDWKSAALGEAAMLCPECGSHLVFRKDTSKTHVQYADAVCRACGAEIAAEKLVEAALEAHFEVEAHVSVKDGGDPPLNICPECGVTAYITWNEENGCAWCETTLEECGRCGVGLTPDNVSDANSTLCSYCDHLMSKDD